LAGYAPSAVGPAEASRVRRAGPRRADAYHGWRTPPQRLRPAAYGPQRRHGDDAGGRARL